MSGPKHGAGGFGVRPCGPCGGCACASVCGPVCPCAAAQVRQLEELVRTSEERMAALRAELLLREENYNKHFKNGGAGEKVGRAASRPASGTPLRGAG